jgi:plastocyanin
MRLPSLTFVVFLGLSAGALAANMTIAQKGRLFSSEAISIRKGETLTFLNDDSVPHNTCRRARETNSISDPSRREHLRM